MWDLRDPALPEYVASLLRKHALARALLRLELTESAHLSSP